MGLGERAGAVAAFLTVCVGLAAYWVGPGAPSPRQPGTDQPVRLPAPAEVVPVRARPVPVHVQAAFRSAGVDDQSGYHGSHAGGYAAVRSLLDAESAQVTEADQRQFYHEYRTLFGERSYEQVELDIHSVLTLRRARARLVGEGLHILDEHTLPGALDD